MPRYSRKRKAILPYGIYQVAKSAARAAQYAERVKRIEEAASLMGEASGVASGNVTVRREAAKTYGRGLYTGSGAYGIRKAIGKWGKKAHIGKMLMDAGISAATKMTGMGSYEPETNALIMDDSPDVVPLFHEERDDGVVFSKREYVAEIFAPDFISGESGPVHPFVLQSFPINPGLERTFPWLSQIAQNFDEYELVQCIFTFKSTTTESTSASNGQVGTVIMATNYNAAAPEFKDKSSMQHYESSKSCRLTQSMQHGVECDPEKRSGSEGLYIRSNPIVNDQDIKTYDHGKFQIAIANCAPNYANVSLGELWVSYTVKLRKSKFFTSRGLGISRDIFISNGGELRSNPFGTNPCKGQQNNIGIELWSQATAANGFPGGVNGDYGWKFPANFAGALRLMVSLEGNNLAYNGSYGQFIRTVTGNVTEIRDLYANFTEDLYVSDDRPLSCIHSVTQNGYVMELHLRIGIATGGIENTLRITNPFSPGGGNITQMYCEFSEYNAGFSGSALGITKSDAPVWVTIANGTQVVIDVPTV